MEDLSKDSKYLSRLLRHQPELLDLHMDQAGWVPVKELRCRFTPKELHDIVESDPKSRYQFSRDNMKIRAVSGHSLPWVDPDLIIVSEVPELLFHGTSAENINLIFQTGSIKRMGRNYIHLSDSSSEAVQAGRRHGEPGLVVLEARKMLADGFVFKVPQNNQYYLVSDDIPTDYFREIIWTCTSYSKVF